MTQARKWDILQMNAEKNTSKLRSPAQRDLVWLKEGEGGSLNTVRSGTPNGETSVGCDGCAR